MHRFTPLALALVVATPLPAQTNGPRPPAGVDLAGMDTTVQPGDSFWQYANGTWLKQAEIPPDRSSWGPADELGELTDRRTADLFKQVAASDAPAGSDRQKIRDYYAAFLDSVAIERKGIAPLKPALDSIAALADRKALSRYLGTTLRADVDIFNATNLYTPNLLGLWVAQDLDDPSHYSAFLVQGGLEMPDRSYYLDSSSAITQVREQYRPHVAAMLKLGGVAEPEAKADLVMQLETRMARVHLSREASSDVEKGNNHWPRADFPAKAPGLDWDAYFQAAGLEAVNRFVVWQPSAVTGLSALVASEPLDTWKAWLAFHSIQAQAAVLPRAFGRQSFAFFGATLSGTKQQRDRWKRAISATNAALGYAVGRLYVERYFPPAEKKRAEAMVANIIAAFRDRIDRLEWMAPATKREAKAKLAVLKVGVGYPDHWPDYSGLEVKAGDAFGNAVRSELWELRHSLAKLDKPVDRSEWVMIPHLVNAVNLPAMNAMNFPAAILQPPYFDPHRPAALDYGAIGATIGHEVSHSFDDSGALFDSKGRLRNWWTPEDFKHFKASGEQLAAQYDKYRPFPDLAVNGNLTLGENIADLAGLTASYEAYRRSLGGKPAPKADGFTGDQLFFISYGQSWRDKVREPALRNQLLTDGHAPGEYRALTVRNLDPWYSAFGVKPGEALYLEPGERVRIW
ncbi:MAG TPA: M13 family metallopeptidase [Gemmatimonadales bacterium]|jgi:predicted metalloendopeptidase